MHTHHRYYHPYTWNRHLLILISAIVRPFASSSASNVFDMGFPLNHANRRRVALPLSRIVLVGIPWGSPPFIGWISDGPVPSRIDSVVRILQGQREAL
jgi:hypothetical protein